MPRRNKMYKKIVHCPHSHNFKGYKDHKCESCGKSFPAAEGSNKYIQAIHEGHINYKCGTCYKSFSQTGHLKKKINSPK